MQYPMSRDEYIDYVISRVKGRKEISSSDTDLLVEEVERLRRLVHVLKQHGRRENMATESGAEAMRRSCEKCGRPVDKEAWKRHESHLYCDGECDCRCWGPGPNPDCPAHPNGW